MAILVNSNFYHFSQKHFQEPDIENSIHSVLPTLLEGYGGEGFMLSRFKLITVVLQSSEVKNVI